METALNPELPTFQSVLLSIIELKETIIAQSLSAKDREASFAKTELAIEKLTRQISRTEKQVGEITDTLGKYVEEQVRPKAISEFKKFGVILNESHFRVTNEDDKGNTLYEIDLLLVNTEFAVAVESKSKLKIDDVDDHLKRLEKVRTHPTKGLKNVKIIGAVAGMIVPKNVLEYAIKKGLFVFVPTGETVKIANEKSFKFKTWVTE